MQTQRGSGVGCLGLNTQIVSLHINLAFAGTIHSKKLVGSRGYRFAGVGLQGTLESNVAARAGYIHAVVLGFVKRVGKLYKHTINAEGWFGIDRRRSSQRGCSDG